MESLCTSWLSPWQNGLAERWEAVAADCSIMPYRTVRKIDHSVLGGTKVVRAVDRYGGCIHFWLSINSALDQQSRLECSEFTCNGPGDTMYPGQSSE
jgi:hypothetical protein